ncbi:MAG TPA: hypothetical protein VH561_12930 [Micromonosporaceae bacterium]|jgi:hypothetical protein
MAYDVYIGDIPGAFASAEQLQTNGQTVADAAHAIESKIITAFQHVNDQTLVAFRDESLTPYCQALKNLAATCDALGTVAKKIMQGSIDADAQARQLFTSNR